VKDKTIIMIKNKNLFYYVSGFVDGEGTFNVSFTKQKYQHNDQGFRWLIHVCFQIYQHEDHRDILELLKDKVFHTGRIYRKSTPYNVLTFTIDNPRSLQEKVIPFFEKYQLIVKQKDFLLFKKVVNLILQKRHLTKKGFTEIIDIAFQMNANGKQRKYSKEYILESATGQLSD
jgi:hypothetical protein